jgi:RNA polymerase sigma-70 factor, ECF subfamily
MQKKQPCQPTAGDDELNARLAAHLHAARLGDVGAFEDFYAQSIRKVMPMVRRLCGGHCEDALADAYFQAWRTLDSFDAERGSALAWIKVIAASRARDLMRAERVRHGGADGAPGGEEVEIEEPGRGPEQHLQSRQLGLRVRSAVSQLPCRQRTVIALAYYGECSPEQIAAATGLAQAAIRTLMRDSHARLHSLLRGDARAGAP